MRPEYYEVYTTLYDQYTNNDLNVLTQPANRPGELALIGSVTSAIDQSPFASFLRADAKYFLLVNFHNLIIKPMVEASYTIKGFSIPPTPALASDISSDVSTIISNAANNGDYRAKNNDLISAHQIMKTVDELWQQLKSTKFETWG